MMTADEIVGADDEVDEVALVIGGTVRMKGPGSFGRWKVLAFGIVIYDVLDITNAR